MKLDACINYELQSENMVLPCNFVSSVGWVGKWMTQAHPQITCMVLGERTILGIYQCPLKHAHAPFLHFSVSPFLCFDSTTSNSWEAAWATVMYRGGSYTLRPLQEYIDSVTTVSTTSNSDPGTNRCLYTVLWHAAIGLGFLHTVSWKKLHILLACNTSLPNSFPRLCG